MTLGDNNGRKVKYTIEGYGNPKGRERFDKINRDISEAQKSDQWLEVTAKDGVIVSTKLTK